MGKYTSMMPPSSSKPKPEVITVCRKKFAPVGNITDASYALEAVLQLPRSI